MLRPLIEHRLRAAWQRRGPLAVALWPLACLYGALAAWQARRQRRQARRLPVPVVVIGNLVAGGAGKTPTTLAVAAHLQAQGWRPGIISRGHGRQRQDCREVLPDSHAADVGDEPLLLRRRSGLPVFVAPRRAQAGQALLAAHPQVNLLLCDDGLQHHALARDVDIVVFDSRGIGNGWLLPAGPLREPWPRPVSLVLWTEPPPPAAAAQGIPVQHIARRQLADHALTADGQRLPLTSLQGQPLLAVAGIARPEAFFSMLRAAGLQPAPCLALPDHFDFARWQPPLAPGQRLICTEKDAVKLWPQHPQALAVPLALAVPPAFFGALDAALNEALDTARKTAPGVHAP